MPKFLSLISGTTISASSCLHSPIVCAKTCFVGSGAGLTGTAASLTAGNTTCFGGYPASCYLKISGGTLTGNLSAPIICASTCFVGSGAGLTGTAASLTTGVATSAGNTTCFGGYPASCYLKISGGTLTGNLNVTNARILPVTDNTGYIGEDIHRWAGVYAGIGDFSTVVTSPTVCASTCFIGSGAGLTGTASSLTVGNATNASTANNSTCLNGQLASYYQTASNAITTSNIASQSVNYATTAGNALCLGGTPLCDIKPISIRGNLGNPSIEEMALFHGEFNNKLRFVPAALQEESTNGSTWTTSARATAQQLADIMLGEGQTGNIAAIPSPGIGNNGYYRLTWNASQTGYVYLNALYIYNSTNGNNVNFKLEGFSNSSSTWVEFTNGTLSNWPGHTFIPHSTIPFWTSDSDKYSSVRITFQIINATNANPFSLYAIEWFGGYPAGRRNMEHYDSNKNVYFPAAINAQTCLMENGIEISSKYLGIGATANNSTCLNGQLASYYQTSSNAITTSNIASQSVNYATTAGSATIASCLGAYPASCYFRCAGGTLTGSLTLTGNQYYTSGSYALNAQNSDMICVNGIYWSDLADGAGEGLMFYRSATTWDRFYACNGKLMFSPNVIKSGTTAGNCVWTSGEFGTFAGSACGLVPSSAGGTSNFLRADGSWASAVGTVALNDLSDVAISTPANGHVLTYSGSSWCNVAPVDISTNASSGQVICFNGTTLCGTNAIVASTSVCTPLVCGPTSGSIEIRTNAAAVLCGINSSCTSLYYGGSERFKTIPNGVCILGCGFATDFVASSDCRLKTGIQPISNALSTITQLQGIYYCLCDDERCERHMGLVAQDVQNIIPEVVSHVQPSEGDDKYGIVDERLGLKYDKLTAILIEAIKEQQAQILNLEIEINKLKGC